MTTKPTATPALPRAQTEPLDLSGVDTLGYRLRLAQNLVFRDFNERFAELGLTQSLWAMVVLIDANPGLRQSDIGAALSIRPANLVDLIDSLIERGLVLKSPIPSDRRAFGLYLTTEGAQFARKADKIHQKHLRRLRELLGEDYDTLYDTLKRLMG